MIRYQLNLEGIDAFERDTLHDIFTEMDKPNAHMEDYDIFITIGNREIKIPIFAQAHDELMDYLKSMEEEVNE